MNEKASTAIWEMQIYVLGMITLLLIGINGVVREVSERKVEQTIDTKYWNFLKRTQQEFNDINVTALTSNTAEIILEFENGKKEHIQNQTCNGIWMKRMFAQNGEKIKASVKYCESNV